MIKEGINARGRHNNCKYLCTQHRSTSIHKTNTNRQKRRNFYDSEIVFTLRSILSDMRTVTPASFCFPFSWNIFFHPLTFSLYVSLGLKWVSCRQYIYGSCFCIHSASLCLLVRMEEDNSK